MAGGTAGSVAVLIAQERVPASKPSPYWHLAGSYRKILTVHLCPAQPSPSRDPQRRKACLCAGAAVGYDPHCPGGHSNDVSGSCQ